MGQLEITTNTLIQLREAGLDLGGRQFSKKMNRNTKYHGSGQESAASIGSAGTRKPKTSREENVREKLWI